MKKLTLIAVAMIIVALVNFSTSNAQGPKGNKGKNTTSAQKANFVDANGDGLCDNAGTGTCTGTCTGTGTGGRHNFVDADGDGLCDNCGGTCTNTGYTAAPKHTFVDANNDGVCDVCGKTAGTCTGTGTPKGKGYKGGK